MRNKKQFKRILFIITASLSMLPTVSAQWYMPTIKQSEKQINYLIGQCQNRQLIPRSYNPEKGVECVDIEDWTSGFFVGTLWRLYKFTNDIRWKQQAMHYTGLLDPVQYLTSHHDVGFMIMSSYGLAYEATNDTAYRTVIVHAAQSLASRFREKARTIQSWEPRTSRTGVSWQCPVVIDNMMNLELLFKASKLSGDNRFREIAVSHADRVIKNHIRPDFSAFHVVNYDIETGNVTDRDTWQGLARNSTWSRGQAWGIYGFTMCYRETGDAKYLETAIKLADFYINHPNMPEDKIPLWDFNAGDKGYKSDWDYKQPVCKTQIPRDASAAAITASALFELCGMSEALREKYFGVAETMLKNLSSPDYLAKDNSNGGFILKHSVGNMPRSLEVDVPLNYADYYFLEALFRYQQLIKS